MRGADDYADAGKRIQRLEDEVFGVLWKLRYFVEEVAPGDAGVLEPGDRKLAETEEPVGVASPLDIEVVCPGEGDHSFLAFEFVEDCAVVDAMDGSPDAIAIIEELAALLFYFRDADGSDAVDAFGADEVADGLLPVGVDLEEHHVFGGVVVEDSFTEEAMVGVDIEIAEEVSEAGIEVVGAHVLAGHFRLVSIEAGEALDLDELRGHTAVLVDNAEVGLDEEGFGVFVGDAVLSGDLLCGSLEIVLVVEELAD